MTIKQLQYVHKLLMREGISFMAEDLALEYSNHRTNKLQDLFYHETQQLISFLAGPSSKSKMQRKILSMAHEMRWEHPNGKVNIEKLDAWCVKHTPHHKPFNKLTEHELPLVVSIFEKMYKTHLNSI